MNVVFLNPENSLFIQSETLPLTKNGYLFTHDFRAGESGKCSFLSGKESVPFSISPEFFLQKNPAFTTFFGQGNLTGTLFLRVNPAEPPGEFPFPDDVRIPEKYTLSEKRSLQSGAAFYYFCERGTGSATVFDGEPVSVGATNRSPDAFNGTENDGAENVPAFGGTGRYVLLSPEKKVIFSAPANRLEITEKEGTFRVIRNVADLRQHKTDAVRSLADGKISTYTVLPQTYIDPLTIDEALLPVAFLEEVFVSGAVEDFLSRSLRPRAKDIGAFLGDFCGVLPAKEAGSATLLFSRGVAETVKFSVRDGVIYDLFVDDGT